MANRIQGITIELDGDTRPLQKALADVDKQSRDLQKELRDVERLLKFDPGNVEALAQKQELLAQQVENTTERLNRLRAAQSQVERQFQRGEIGADQYRAFRREIQFTEAQLSKFKRELESVNETKALKNARRDADRVAESLDKAKEAAGELRNQLETVGAASAAGAVASALDSASLDTSIEISMDVPPESVQAVKSAVKTVTSYIGDQEAALEGVRRQWALNANASDEANARIVKGAGAIARAYAGIDFTELIQETNEVSKSLEISNDEALGLVNALLKMGFPPEQIDIISEYGLQLRMAGYEAEEIQAIFAAGIDTGTWNIDNLLDGLKEGRIRLAEFGEEVPKAVKELLEGTNISAKQLQQWGQAVAQGGETGKQAMVQVAQALNNVDNETKRNTLGVAIFGKRKLCRNKTGQNRWKLSESA
jgi:phage-related minor tail protein